jgi:hypothetical protein
MGFMNPDATFLKSDTLVSSMALEMRRKYSCTVLYVLVFYDLLVVSELLHVMMLYYAI